MISVHLLQDYLLHLPINITMMYFQGIFFLFWIIWYFQQTHSQSSNQRSSDYCEHALFS